MEYGLQNRSPQHLFDFNTTCPVWSPLAWPCPFYRQPTLDKAGITFALFFETPNSRKICGGLMNSIPVASSRQILHLIIVGSLLVPSVGFSAEPPKSSPPPQVQAEPLAQTLIQAINSEALFNQIVQDPFLSQTYQQTIGLALRSFADQNMAQFFDSNPIYLRARPQLIAAEEEGVQEAVLNGQASMTRITAETNPRIYKLLVEIARKYAYTDEQIAKMQAFVMDDMNASMSSPFVDYPVIYIGKPLIESMSDEAIKGVIGHEFGHNIFKHVELGFQMMSMMNQLGGIFAKAAGFTNIDFSQLADFDPDNRGDLNPDLHAFWSKAFSSMLNGGVNPQARGKNSSLIKIQRKMFATYMKTMDMEFKNSLSKHEREAMSAITGMTQANPDLGVASISRFLDSLVLSLQMLPVPQTTVNYFRHLQSSFAAALEEGHPPFQVGAAEFVKMSGLAMTNISQAMEMSADAGGLIQTLWRYMTEGFLAFTDAPLDPVKAKVRGQDGQFISAKEQLSRLIKERHKEWENFVATQSPEQLMQSLGGNDGNDHPIPLIRMAYFNLRSQMTPTLMLRNPFTRFIMLYQGLLDRQQMVDLKIAAVNQGAAQAADSIKAATGADPTPDMLKAATANLQKRLNALQAEKAEAAQKAQAVSDVIVKLVMDPALQGLTSANPRLMDLIDFQLAQRQDTLEIFEEMTKNKISADQLKVARAVSLNVSPYDTPLMQSILKSVKNSKSDKAAALIEILISGKSTLQNVKTARSQLATEGNYAKKDSHRPVDVGLPENSNLLISNGRFSCVNLIPQISD